MRSESTPDAPRGYCLPKGHVEMAACIAFIISIGYLGGFASPELFGCLRTHVGLGIVLAAVGELRGLGGCLAVMATRKNKNKTH